MHKRIVEFINELMYSYELCVNECHLIDLFVISLNYMVSDGQ